MQSEYPERFERDMGCSEAEWLGWMPRAMVNHPWKQEGQGIHVRLGTGSLSITWSPLPERRIALLRMQRLLVRFAFEGVDADARKAFMKPFDLSMQRGGG
ncbi:MAG: hypothetical protein MUF44_01545 [Hydrogenophaga sp.]|nr:hypothetical protein [Hydrogenophaga sp.]